MLQLLAIYSKFVRIDSNVRMKFFFFFFSFQDKKLEEVRKNKETKEGTSED